MSNNSKIDIASIDQQLSERGYFCLIDWLLAENQLQYRDYESWRYGRLGHVDEALPHDAKALAELFANSHKHCTALGLCSEPQIVYRWQDEHRASLIASQNPEHHRLLTQHWLRPQDLPQLDLFMDNSALITENKLRDTLTGRDFDLAKTLQQQLIMLNAAHPNLGAYQDLINYGLHMQANSQIDADAIDAELEGLKQEVLPLAMEILAGQARDYLAFAWRRLADNLSGLDFNPLNSDCHSSFALAQIPDWPGVLQCLQDEPNLYQHAVLLERQATAYQVLHRTGEALVLWCLLMEQHTKYAEQVFEQRRGEVIHQLWEEFLAFEDDFDTAEFPAFVLANQPGLIRHLPSFPSLKTEPSQAMLVLLECKLANEDEIAARARLQKTSPALLKFYMEGIKR